MVKKIKVCFVANYAWAFFNREKKIPFGGSELQLYQLAKELAQDGSFGVYFIVGDFGQGSPLFYEGIKVYKGSRPISGKEIMGKCFSITRYFKALKRILKLWITLRRISADIYIQRSAGGETGIIALFAKVYHKKFIYMVAHEIDVSGEYIRNNGMRGQFFKWGLRNANLVIVQNREQKNLLKNNFNRVGLRLKSAYPITEVAISSKKTILWVGRCEPWKDPELFLELAQQFLQETFIMICQPSPAKPEFFQQIKNRAKKISNLTLIEYVPFPEIDSYFWQSKVLVNTSYYEGFPNTFIQAAKNKTPVLSFRVNPDNFITQYRCGFWANGDKEKMKEQLKDLLSNRVIWKKMSENAFSYAKENHDINKIVPEFKKLLEDLLLKESG